MELVLSEERMQEHIRIIKKALRLDTPFTKQHFEAAKNKADLARVVRWRNAFCVRVAKKPKPSKRDRRELQALRRAISHHIHMAE